MAGPQYTSCVAPADYEDYSGAEVVLTADWWEATDYMLHRKLVCLGSVEPGKGSDGQPCLVRSDVSGPSCAIGRVLSFEPPSSKSFPDSIDNDFSFNIVLRPHAAPAVSDNPFVDSGWWEMQNQSRDALGAVRNGYQGELLKEQETPRPHEAGGDDPRYGGYTSAMFFDAARDESGTASVSLTDWIAWFLDGTVRTYPLDTPGIYSVPVLHCECEGSRINDVFNVADQMPGGGSGCKKHWYTWLGCALLRLISLPFTTTFIAEAWGRARDGDYHDAMIGNGDLAIGDLVMVRGRWVFDAGHKGHNEIHAVSTIQKIPDSRERPAEPPTDAAPDEFDRFYRDWCGLAGEVPPDHAPGERPAGMTASQAALYDNQQRPGNQYLLHPDLDGCLARSRPSIRTVEPDLLLPRDAAADVIVLGSGFVNGATVAVLGPGVPVSKVVHQSQSQLTATLALTSGMPMGPRDVTVTNPDGGNASCHGCLTITDEPPIR